VTRKLVGPPTKIGHSNYGYGGCSKIEIENLKVIKVNPVPDFIQRPPKINGDLKDYMKG
jgi:hypothetical protein